MWLKIGFPTILMVLGVFAWSAVADARSRRRRRVRHHRHSRVAMLLPLPPTWTASTHGVEVATDAPDEEHPPKAKGGLKPSRVREGVSKAACLRELRRLRIPFKMAAKKWSIWLPVRITGPMYGVTYKSMYYKSKPLVDCQFALGLYRAAKIFQRFGVVQLRYTSTYRSPPRRRWRTVGHHPQGMAIDINEVVFRDGKKLSILKDWEKFYGGPGNCVGRVKSKSGALLRRITCALEKAHIFRRIISPDSDFAHQNHWHISGARVGDAFVRARWAGRTLTQPLPGDKGFARYYRWYSCWKFRKLRRRYRCYRQRARRKPRAPVKYKRPRHRPRVAIWLKSQVRAAPSLPPTARAVSLGPKKTPRVRSVPRRRRR
jgi:hypothetical protein